MKNLEKLILFVDGKKSYFVAVVVAVYNLLVATNALSPGHVAQINLILGAGFGAALRSALAKLE